MGNKYTKIINGIIFLTGVAVGCLIMFASNNDVFHHYNVCQEEQLLKNIAEIKEEKNWYIKEDSKGKLRLFQLSTKELLKLDSLTQIEAKQYE